MRSILIYLIACLMLAGCSAKVDSRLAEADSLLCAESYDTAFSLLKSVDANSLRGRGNKAYYALLYTQAQYKCYDPIRSDSLIDVAVDYYGDSGDYDKRIRSLIYKGAALADMGDKFEAIDWYKKAEAAADTSDYYNLGYINLRLGSLYGGEYIENNEHISKIKKALAYFEKAQDERYVLTCLSQLGAFYRAFDSDSAKIYLDKAIALSKERCDSSSYYNNLSMLARLYGMDSLYNKEKETALHVIREGGRYSDNDQYYDVSEAYAMLGKLDSAEYYFNQIKPDGFSANDSVIWLVTKYKLDQAKGDYKSAFFHYFKMDSIAYSIYTKSLQKELFEAEKKFNNKSLEVENVRLKNSVLYTLLAITIVAFVLLSVWLVAIKRKNKIREQLEIISQLQNDSNGFKKHCPTGWIVNRN